MAANEQFSILQQAQNIQYTNASTGMYCQAAAVRRDTMGASISGLPSPTQPGGIEGQLQGAQGTQTSDASSINGQPPLSIINGQQPQLYQKVVVSKTGKVLMVSSNKESIMKQPKPHNNKKSYGYGRYSGSQTSSMGSGNFVAGVPVTIGLPIMAQNHQNFSGGFTVEGDAAFSHTGTVDNNTSEANVPKGKSWLGGAFTTVLGWVGGSKNKEDGTTTNQPPMITAISGVPSASRSPIKEPPRTESRSPIKIFPWRRSSSPRKPGDITVTDESPIKSLFSKTRNSVSSGGPGVVQKSDKRNSKKSKKSKTRDSATSTTTKTSKKKSSKDTVDQGQSDEAVVSDKHR